MDYNNDLIEHFKNNVQSLFWTWWYDGPLEQFAISKSTGVVYWITQLTFKENPEVFYAFSLTKEALRDYIEGKRGRLSVVLESENHFLFYTKGSEFEPDKVEEIKPSEHFMTEFFTIQDAMFEGFFDEKQEQLYLNFINQQC